MSEKLWAGRTAGALDAQADAFNASIGVDQKMFKQDVQGSMAHAAMLGATGILTPAETDAILGGLQAILAEWESGALTVDPTAEDVHMFVEAELTKRIGAAGKKLHTARSRNDQVATDLRLYLRDETQTVVKGLKNLLAALVEQAKANTQTIMPGYTHLQRAQPVTFAHHLMAYAMMFTRDIDRLADAVARMNVSPLGCCALAGTTYPTNRDMTAEALGFNGIALNSIDGVSDRDFCVELLAAFALIMTHLSRLAEEIVLWASWEFHFVELSDAYTTGSSIMPQKKNADMAELTRGKTGRVYGDLMAMLTVLKGLPLAYNKDLQEDKEAVFDGLETVQQCLAVMAPMVATMQVNAPAMLAAAGEGFINATDLADYLTGKGMPFRDAYKLVGQIVAECIATHHTLETLPPEAYRRYSPLFGPDLPDAINLQNCVARRTSAGGTAPDQLARQFAFVAHYIES